MKEEEARLMGEGKGVVLKTQWLSSEDPILDYILLLTAGLPFLSCETYTQHKLTTSHISRIKELF